jgi:hypothetical protein
MIVKVAPNRHDGKSSFEALGRYITKGIAQSGDRFERTSWKRLTQYITKKSVLDELGDNVEKTIAVEIGNLISLKTAANEMFTVANRNKRIKNPVYHYILSWPEHERPDVHEIMAAARHSLKTLELQDHQYIIAIHANTDNIHAHIEVNRVSPVTYLATDLAWDHSRLHKAARESEIEFGWSHDPGLYDVVEVNGHKHVVKNESFVDPELERVKGGANKIETWNGIQSLETWCRGEPSVELKRLLADPATMSWQTIHRTLAKFGLELRDSGGGGMQVVNVGDGAADKTNRPITVSASKAFRFMKRPELEQRFGAFERFDSTVAPETIKTYKRDPLKRLDRRLSRKASRDALFERFTAEQRALRARNSIVKMEIRQSFGDDEKARYKRLTAHRQTQRLVIRNDASLSARQKQQAYSLLSMTTLQAKTQLKEQIRQEREDRQALFSAIPTWREWVEQQVQLGDDAAISALRGMIYQEKREAKKAGKADQEVDSDESSPVENAILPAVRKKSDPYVRAIQNIVWKVTGTGQVVYSFKNGSAGFTDQGNKLTFGRKDVSDEALLVTLRYAKEKWGNEIHIAGGDAIFKERTARLATTLGMRVKNPELQHLAIAKPPASLGRHSTIHNPSGKGKIDHALLKPHTSTLGGIGSDPPPAARARLRTLSDLGMVYDQDTTQTRPGKVLLSGAVPGQLELAGEERDQRMRRSAHGGEGVSSTPALTDNSSVEAVIKRFNAEARIQYASTKNKAYSGKIVAHHDGLVVQQTGRNNYVIHEQSAFKTIPAVDTSVTIHYKSGVASVGTSIKHER